jgi:hypothetical protein
MSELNQFPTVTIECTPVNTTDYYNNLRQTHGLTLTSHDEIQAKIQQIGQLFEQRFRDEYRR